MDNRTLKKRAERRQRQQELVEKRKTDTEKLVQDIVNISQFFKQFVNDKRYPKFRELLIMRKQALTDRLISLDETDPVKNALKSERLRAQILTINHILDAPEDFFKAEEEIKKKSPELIKDADKDE